MTVNSELLVGDERGPAPRVVTGERLLMNQSSPSSSWDSRSSRCGSSFECLVALREMAEEGDTEDMDGRASRTDSLGLSGGKDSGIECSEEGVSTLEEFVIPDADLMDRIVAQLELYFSDESLSRDAFLMKHIRRNKEGFVSLKLVASFRKVKSITKDWRQVAHSLKTTSKRLVTNESLTKVRRVDPLLPSLVVEAPKPRTIIAYNMAFEKPSIENVSQLFSAFGDITSVRIFRDSLPPICLQFVSKYPELTQSVIAVVEFEDHASAEKAILGVNSDTRGNWRSNLKVFLLENIESKEENTTRASNNKKRQKREKRSFTVSVVSEPCHQNEDERRPRSQTTACTTSVRQSQAQSPKQRLEPRELRTAVKQVKAFQPRQKSNSYSNSYSSNDDKSKVDTRDQTYVRLSFATSGQNNGQVSSTHANRLPDNLIRLPLGPDGSGGFRNKVTKGRSQSCLS